jgi:hypothetical protein
MIPPECTGSQHHLCCSLYTMKQSGYAWNNVLEVALVELRLVHQEHDRGLHQPFRRQVYICALHVETRIIPGDGRYSWIYPRPWFKV